MASSTAPMTWSRPISIWLAPTLVLALGVFVILLDGFGIQTAVSDRLFDAYQRHLPNTVQSPVPVEAMDLPALDEDTLVGVARALVQQGVSVIALAAPLEPGASPLSLAAKLPPGSDAGRAALAKLPEPGHDLAAALQDIKNVVPVMLGAAGRMPHLKAHFVYRGGSNPFSKIPAFAVGAASPAILENSAAGVAAPTLIPDGDGVVRRMPMALSLESSIVPGLATEILRVAEDKNPITVTTDERNPLTFLRGVGIGALETSARLVPVGADGSVRIHFAWPQEQRLRADDIDQAGSQLKGAIVILGPPWSGGVQTPLGQDSVAGVIAQAVKGLLTGEVLTRPDWMGFVEALALAALGAGMIFLLRFGLGWAASLVMAGAILLGLVSWYLYAAHGVLADAATPALFLALAFAAGATAWIHDLRLAYAGLRMAFSDSLPRATIEKIARRPHLLRLEGEIRSVTYLVCGVRGLAGLGADFKDDAAGFTSLMQKALTPLIDQALAHGGTIDRLTADGFAAFWNAPLDDADHALHACEAANGMAIMSSRVTEDLAQQKYGEEPPPLVEIGVGIATGPVIAGGFGGYGRMGYGVNGDAVSLAQRIQTLSLQYGPALIVADETKRQAERGFAFLEVDTIAMSAKAPPITLYAIMGNPVTRASPKFRALTVFHDHIFQAIRKQHWQMARDLIMQCRRLSGASQKMYDLHLARIAYYEKHPPGENWDGAFRPILE
jgi:adenylate cyclase